MAHYYLQLPDDFLPDGVKMERGTVSRAVLTLTSTTGQSVDLDLGQTEGATSGVPLQVYELEQRLPALAVDVNYMALEVVTLRGYLNAMAERLALHDIVPSDHNEATWEGLARQVFVDLERLIDDRLKANTTIPVVQRN